MEGGRGTKRKKHIQRSTLLRLRPITCALPVTYNPAGQSGRHIDAQQIARRVPPGIWHIPCPLHPAPGWQWVTKNSSHLHPHHPSPCVTLYQEECIHRKAYVQRHRRATALAAQQWVSLGGWDIFSIPDNWTSQSHSKSKAITMHDRHARTPAYHPKDMARLFAVAVFRRHHTPNGPIASMSSV